MKMKTLTNFLKIGILLFGFSIILSSCDNDELIEPQEQKLIIAHKNFDFIENNINLLNKVNKLSKSINKTASKGNYLSKNEFTVFKERVTYIKTPDNTRESYSFYIERNNINKTDIIENLVLSKTLEDNEYKAHIITYSFPEGMENEKENFVVTNFEELNIENVSGLFNKSGCENTYEYTVVETEHECYTGKHNGVSDQGNCDYEETGNSGPYSTWSIHVTVNYQCDGGESTGGGTHTGDPTDTGNPGNNTPPNNSNPIDTGITLPPSCQTNDCAGEITANTINNLLGNTLNDAELLWLFNNDNQANIIKSLLENSNSLTNQNFSIQIINNLTNTLNYGFSSLELSTFNTKANQIFDIISLNNYADISQYSLADQKTIAQNSLFIGFLPSINSIIGEYWPKNDEEWAVIGNLFAQFLPELALGFIPGSDIIEVIKGANQGDAVAVAIGLAGLIVDAFGGTILKGITKAIKIGKKVFTSFKLTYKFVTVIGKSLKAGLKVSLDGATVILKKSGNEIARIANNVMTFNYSGFGGKIITSPNKTTTVIGKYDINGVGTKNIIDSGLSKSGKNVGGINALSEVPNPNWNDQQIWDNINEPWLRDATSRNDIIRVVSDPNNPSNIFKDNGQLSFFGKEHQLLTKPTSQGGLGYTYNSSTFTYTK